MAQVARTGETFALRGYREALRAIARADRDTAKQVRAKLAEAGAAVEGDARRRVLARKPNAERTAAGYKTRARPGGVRVEQSLRKRSGLHPEWGAWQMRHALIPAVSANEDKTLELLEHALDQIAAEFDRGEEIQ